MLFRTFLPYKLTGGDPEVQRARHGTARGARLCKLSACDISTVTSSGARYGRGIALPHAHMLATFCFLRDNAPFCPLRTPSL